MLDHSIVSQHFMEPEFTRALHLFVLRSLSEIMSSALGEMPAELQTSVKRTKCMFLVKARVEDHVEFTFSTDVPLVQTQVMRNCIHICHCHLNDRFVNIFLSLLRLGSCPELCGSHAGRLVDCHSCKISDTEFNLNMFISFRGKNVYRHTNGHDFALLRSVYAHQAANSE
jgi:hypothetical protein